MLVIYCRLAVSEPQSDVARFAKYLVIISVIRGLVNKRRKGIVEQADKWVKNKEEDCCKNTNYIVLFDHFLCFRGALSGQPVQDIDI